MKEEIHIGDKKVVIELPDNAMINVVEDGDTIRVDIKTTDSNTIKIKNYDELIGFVDVMNIYDKDYPKFIEEDLKVISTLICKNNYNVKHSIDEFVEVLYDSLIENGLEMTEEDFKTIMYSYLAYYGIARDFIAFREIRYVIKELTELLKLYNKELENARSERYRCVLRSKINIISKVIDVLSGIINGPSIVILDNDNVGGAFDFVVARNNEDLRRKTSKVILKQLKTMEHIENSLRSLRKP